jgi:ketosteroid isomerase-like protein
MPARNDAGLPDDYEVTVSYRDPLGNKYEEPITVGVSHRRDMVHLRQHDIHDVYKQLETLVREVKKWSTTSAGGGILTMTRRDVRRRSEEAGWYHRAAEGPLLSRLFFRARLFLSEVCRLPSQSLCSAPSL